MSVSFLVNMSGSAEHSKHTVWLDALECAIKKRTIFIGTNDMHFNCKKSNDPAMAFQSHA